MDGGSLPEIKISELPVGTVANATDQLEANQAGVSRSITVGQVAATIDLSPYAKLVSPVFTGDPQAPTPAPGDNDQSLATTAFVHTAIAAIPAPPSVTVPAGTIAFGDAGGVVTGNSTLAWDNTNKAFAITGYTGAAAGFSVAGSVPASPAVDAFLMSISNPSGNTGNIFRLRAGAAGTTDQFKVDMTGDAAASGSIQAFALSAPPAGGNGAFGIFLGNFSGGNSGLYFGTGAPTLSTFGRYGSLYINTATPGIPYYNNNGTTGWDRLVGETATQTLTNKTFAPASISPGSNGQVLTTVSGAAAWAAPAAAITVVRTTAFTTVGANTWTPNANMVWATLKALGGGGGGGGCISQPANIGGAGGAGGAGSMSIATISKATAGASQTVTIGAAGTAGTAAAGNGGAGGDTSVGALCIGKGGSGGTGMNASQVGGIGGLGGVAGTGDETGTGAPGGSSVALASGSGAANVSGIGGSSPWGGGGRNVVSATSAGGAAATGFGAGGSGGVSFSGAANAAGAAGTAGKVVIIEYCTL